MLRAQQGDGRRDVRRGERGPRPAAEGEAAEPAGEADPLQRLLQNLVRVAVAVGVDARLTRRRHDRERRAPGGVAGLQQARLDAADPDDVGVVGGKAQVVLVAVAGDGGDDDAGRHGPGDGVVLDRRRALRPVGPSAGHAEREVDHPRALGRRPVDRRRDVGGGALVVVRAGADGEDRGVRSEPHAADPVAGALRDDPGHEGAMAETVGGGARPRMVEHRVVFAGERVAEAVAAGRRGDAHAAVDDRDDDPFAGRAQPGRFGADLPVVPLLHEERVVGDRGRNRIAGSGARRRRRRALLTEGQPLHDVGIDPFHARCCSRRTGEARAEGRGGFVRRNREAPPVPEQVARAGCAGQRLRQGAPGCDADEHAVRAAGAVGPRCVFCPVAGGARQGSAERAAQRHAEGEPPDGGRYRSPAAAGPHASDPAA